MTCATDAFSEVVLECESMFLDLIGCPLNIARLPRHLFAWYPFFRRIATNAKAIEGLRWVPFA